MDRAVGVGGPVDEAGVVEEYVAVEEAAQEVAKAALDAGSAIGDEYLLVVDAEFVVVVGDIGERAKKDVFRVEIGSIGMLIGGDETRIERVLPEVVRGAWDMSGAVLGDASSRGGTAEFIVGTGIDEVVVGVLHILLDLVGVDND